MKLDYNDKQWADRLITKDEKLTQKQISIIKSTAILFLEKGYEATSTREISKLAEVAEGTIFKHYGTKKELLMEVTDRMARALLIPVIMTGIDEVIEAEYESLDDFVYKLIYNRIEVITMAMPLIRIVIQELPFHPEIREIISTGMMQLPFDRIFDKLKARRYIIELPNDELFKLVVSTVGGYLITHYVLFPEFFNKNPEKELENLVEFIVRGMKNYG